MNILNHPEIVASIAAGITAVVTSIVAGLTSIFKRIDKTMSELRPNGGHSIKDQVNRLEQRVDDIYKILAKKDK